MRGELFSREKTFPPHPLQKSVRTKIIFCRGRHPRRPVKQTHTAKQKISLSSWAQSNFFRAKSEEKAQNATAVCGISLQLLVVFLTGCNIFLGKPPKLVRRSLRRIRASVLLRYSLRKTSTSQTAPRFSPLRMTYSGFVWVLSVRKNGWSVNRPYRLTYNSALCILHSAFCTPLHSARPCTLHLSPSFNILIEFYIQNPPHLLTKRILLCIINRVWYTR